MLTNEIKSNDLEVAAGILCFNPVDDIHHMERIENDITSIAESATKSKYNIYLMLGLNKSPVLGTDNPDTIGIGPKTQKLIETLANKYNLPIHEYVGDNGAAKGYRFIQNHLYNDTTAKKIAIFADDYIMPSDWWDVMMRNFESRPNDDFIVPSTSFVVQENLTGGIKFDYHPDWDVRVAPKGDHQKWQYKTIYGGVTIDHINKIYNDNKHLGVVEFAGPPSFETTVFRRRYLDKVGLIDERYYSQWYDNDFFLRGSHAGQKGGIARNAFIFHYGKGGTKSLYKETADQKYEESPVRHFMDNDLKVWNEKWGQGVAPWWGSAKGAKVG